ncbi:NAD(P)/FAD-dependent oxidoreductase [archaeon]|nr:NAD(P)/FAD-dependent oxidoreductase [archaeon]MBL7056807.1 NAD(P)/FAD-dependent oxidoreductase [Candidatus Woesearchaeota archaeon]
MVTIIGGGPIGCYTAALLSRRNDIIVYEENKEVGTPIQCTGILTDTINEIIKLKKEFIANKIWATRIYAPNGKFAKIHFKKPNIIVYRNKFDQYFRDMAIDNGVKIEYNCRFTKRREILNTETRRKKNIKYDKLVGADGPQSKVSTSYGLGKRKHLRGVQALIKKKNDGVVDFFPHIGTYAWAVPESDTILRVGVAAETNTLEIFKNFKKRYKGNILGWQGGIIPLHNPKTITSTKNVFLVGDAAAQIKNTTGGGLVPGLTAAKELQRAIDENKDYEHLWRQKIGKSLWTHNVVRKTMNRFNQNDWNKLINIFQRKSMKKILSEESRDKPIQMLTKTIMKNPSTLLFLRKLMH